jgi:hypothetical protein
MSPLMEVLGAPYFLSLGSLAIYTGEVGSANTSRSKHPVLFWAVTGLEFVLGLMFLCTGIKGFIAGRA